MPAAVGGRRANGVIWATSVLIAAAAGFMAALWATRHLAPGVNVNPLPSMVDCAGRAFGRIGPKEVTADDLKTISGLCWQEISYQGALNDFEIRRLAFYQQYYSNPVLLWMVVFVTLSGVSLAAVQLLASYELARDKGIAIAQDGDLEIDKGKIALRSSVTGLFILVMSFAFFIVFVKFIYRIDQTDIDRASAGVRAAGPDLGQGRLGPPAKAPEPPR